MSANPKLHPVFAGILKPLSEPDPMAPLKKVYAEAMEQKAAAEKKSRFDRQRFIESELVEFRPDFLEATEILAALKTGLALKVGPYGDDLPIEVEHAFEDLKKALDASCPYEPEAYDSMSDVGFDHDNVPYEK